jgi:hypothetical protein
MEATRPTPVDLTEFQEGATRDSVLEKLGSPQSTATESDGASCDFYKLYTKGYGAGGKIPIAVAEGAADFLYPRVGGGGVNSDRGRHQE